MVCSDMTDTSSATLRTALTILLAPCILQVNALAQDAGVRISRQYEESLTIGAFDRRSRYTFFSANWQKQRIPNRASYERHTTDSPTPATLKTGKNSGRLAEVDQDAAMADLRETMRKLSRIEARHPNSRAAIIAHQLLLDAQRIRVAPEDNFLPPEGKQPTN